MPSVPQIVPAGIEKAMRLTFEVIMDEPDIGRIVRIGCWVLTTDYETGEGEWEWLPEKAETNEAA